MKRGNNMKTKIITLCILVALTLTACTGKEPPTVIIDDGSNVSSSQDGNVCSESNVSSQDESNSSESDVSSRDEVNSSESDAPSQSVDSSSESDESSQKNNVEVSSESTVSSQEKDDEVSGKSKTVSDDENSYKEMPQNIITYLEENAEKLQYIKETTSPDMLERLNKELFYVYDSCFEASVDIGAVLDITDESNPTLIYLQKENLGGSLYQNLDGEAAPFEQGFAIKGTVIGVKLDNNGDVLEFYTRGDKAELYDTMIKLAYTNAGLAPD